MQRLEVSGAVRLIYGSLGVKGLNLTSERILKRTCSNLNCSVWGIMHYAVEVAKSVLSLGCMADDQEIGVLFPVQEDTAPRSV